MRELCLYKNEIICIELCLCKDRRNNKIFENQIAETKIRICNQKTHRSGQNESFLRCFFELYYLFCFSPSVFSQTANVSGNRRMPESEMHRRAAMQAARQNR